ncbi:MAG: chemotaxis protein CheX [bacterium]|nr:chemotaxis protein CheX [bacterium]
MDINLINPFIIAIDNAFATMAGKSPERFKPYAKNNTVTQGDVTGIIGFASKAISGTVAISFPEHTALEVFAKIMNEDVKSINRDVEDLVGEIANIVAGGAKTELSNSGLSFHLAIPMVVTGKKHSISHKFIKPVIVVPFKWDGLSFAMEVCLRMSK